MPGDDLSIVWTTEKFEPRHTRCCHLYVTANFLACGPFREGIVNILHGRHRALESALSITGIVAFECALVAGVLLALHIDPGL
jgi:hypothetical protein